MRTVASLLVACSIAVSPALAREDTVYIRAGEARRYATYAPMPRYPTEARDRRIAGHGSIRLVVQIATGRVLRAEVAQSTGSGILDSEALETFRQWQFKPDALRALVKKYNPTDKSPEMGVTIPVNFTLGR